MWVCCWTLWLQQTGEHLVIALRSLLTFSSTYFQAASTPTGWSDLRIGYLSQFIGMSQSEDAFYKNACPNEMARDMANVLDRFDELGAETFSVPSLFNTTQGWEGAVTLILNKRVVVGTGEDLPTYLKTRKQGNDQADEDIVRTIRDLVEFNDRHAVRFYTRSISVSAEADL